MKPVIAIPQMGNDLFRKYMKSKYVQAVKRAGGDVMWIEWGDIRLAKEAAEKYDGLLLPGGADINPALYNAVKSDKCGRQHRERDMLEPALLKEFTALGKPVLGICRGMQMINVYFGGTLHQDIKDMSGVNHSDFLKRKKGNHTVTVVKDSLLGNIVKNETLKVNSLHHQAADAVGEKLIISAVSQDGFTEAVELAGYKFCLGVQWHPEHMAATTPVQQNIITEFVQRCKK